MLNPSMTVAAASRATVDRDQEFGAVVHVPLASQRGRYRADPRRALQRVHSLTR